MSYLRGDNYIWADADGRLHIWVFDGADGWEDSGWAKDAGGRRHAGRENAAGVSIPERVLDEYVMMRLAKLIESGEVGATVDRALCHGNVGGEALAAKALAIREALAGL